MSDVLGRKSGGKEREKFEVVKEELGLDDGMIRELSDIVKFKTLRSLLGNETDKKVAYLIKENEKRDERALKNAFVNLDEETVSKIRRSCGGDLGKLVVFAEVAKGVHGGKFVPALLKLKEVYGDDWEGLMYWVDVAKLDDDKNNIFWDMSELLKDFENDLEMIKVFEEVGKRNNGGDILYLLAKFKKLYGKELRKLEEIKEIIVQMLEEEKTASLKWKLSYFKRLIGGDLNKFKEVVLILTEVIKNKHGLELVDGLVLLKKLYGQDLEQFKQVLKMLREVASGEDGFYVVSMLVNAQVFYGTDLEQFKLWWEVAKLDAGGASIAALVKFQDFYKVKPEIFAFCFEVVKEQNGWKTLELLFSLREMYGDDLSKIKEVKEVLVEGGDLGLIGMSALIEMRDLYGTDFQKLKDLRSFVGGILKSPGGEKN